jgi:hypothetical protein
MKLCPLCAASAPDSATTCPQDGQRLVVNRQGQVIGGQRLLGLAGVGPQGTTVWEAEGPGGRSAVKLFEEGEAGMLATLPEINHPAFVRIRARGEEAGVPWIALPLLSGPSLADRVDEQRLAEREATATALEVLAALAAAHRAGQVHGNLKATNLVYEGRRWLLLDAGLARGGRILGRTQSTQPAAAAHLAPEQLVTGRALPATDVYQVAALVYFAVTGQPAFSAATMDDLARLKMTAVPDLSALSPALRTALAVALSPRPEDRPADAAAFAALFGAPAVAPARPRSGGRTWLLAGLLGATIAAAVVYSVLDRDSGSQTSGLEALEKARAALKRRAPFEAHQALQEARKAGLSGPLVDEVEASLRAAPALDVAEALVERGDLSGARARFEEARAIAPDDPRVLQLATRLVAPGSAAPEAPGSVGPGSVAPGSVAPGSVAPGSVAPGSVARPLVAPASVAPASVAPASVAPVAPPTELAAVLIEGEVEEPMLATRKRGRGARRTTRPVVVAAATRPEAPPTQPAAPPTLPAAPATQAAAPATRPAPAAAPASVAVASVAPPSVAAAPSVAPPTAAAAPLATGFLSAQSVQRADVYVDGRRLGPTPLWMAKVPAGRHTVELRGSDGAVIEQQTVVIESKQMGSVFFRKEKSR